MRFKKPPESHTPPHLLYVVHTHTQFFCALHPEMRGRWAATWARLIRPGGRLVTLVFPIGEEFRFFVCVRVWVGGGVWVCGLVLTMPHRQCCVKH